MARRALIAAVTAAAFFAVGLALAQDPVGVGEKTPPVDVIGNVTAVSPDEMTVTTDQNQEWKFKLNDQTQRLAGMAVGDRVRVRYKDEWGTDLALNVMKADTTTTARTTPGTYTNDDLNRPNTSGSAYDANRNTAATNTGNTYHYVDGRVVSFTPTEIVVRNDAGETQTFVVTTGMDRTYFTEGNRVRLNYEMEGDRMMARQVAPVTAGSTSYTTVARNTTPDRDNALPNTGSSLPLIALIGFLSLLTGSGLWLVRNRIV